MRTIQDYIVEAAKRKPSDLKKLKDTSKVVDVVFKGGDRYDLSTNTNYTDKFRYYSGESDGYITDKEGNVYDVAIGEYSSDSGYIAGGTMNWSCSIKYKDDIKITFQGYHGLFSEPSTPTASTIVSDIKDGMYLEDYVARHVKDIRPFENQEKDYIKELVSKGDKNARTYAGIKADNKQERKYKFYIQNIYLGQEVTFEIKEDSLAVSGNLAYWASNEVERKTKKYNFNRDEVMKEFNQHINDGLVPMMKKLIGKILKTDNIFEYKGLSGAITAKVNRSYCEYLMYNIKKNKFVIADIDDNKIVNDDPEIILGNEVTIDKNNASEKALSLFKRASEAFLKLNKRKQGEYIEQNYKKFYSWQNGIVSISKQKALARDEFKKMLVNNDFDKAKNTFTLSWQLLKDYIEDGQITDPDTNAPVSNAQSEAPKSASSDKLYKTQEDKMDKWHNGERGLNVKALSDAKLKINYKICKEKGYEKEMGILQAEADRRQLNLNESLSMKEFIGIKLYE